MKPEDWKLIRAFYNRPEIVELLAAGKRISPYFIDWLKYFTPIEADAWMSIRGIGMPLVPQYPVLNYFLDFANPYRKIGLELDGRDWHDTTRDMDRDLSLWREGWRIFRIRGSEAFATKPTIDDFEAERLDDPDVQEQVADWMNNTGDGVIRALNEVYFRGNVNGPERFSGGYLNALDLHRLVNFPLLAFWIPKRLMGEPV